MKLDSSHFLFVGKALEGLFRKPQFSPFKQHLEETPARVMRLFEEYFSGVGVDASEELKLGFIEEQYNEMVFLKEIPFVSICSHHIVPFIGVAHFAYIPNARIVGLSKIPRMIEVLSHRPQVQERLTVEIVDTFQQTVKPFGCAVVLEARHFCIEVRGIKKVGVITRTTALRGCFKEGDTKHEFLEGIRK